MNLDIAACRNANLNHLGNLVQKPGKARKTVQRPVEECEPDEDSDNEEVMETTSEKATVGGFIPEPVEQKDESNSAATKTTVVDATVAMVLDI
jgi:hypothetical protein